MTHGAGQLPQVLPLSHYLPDPRRPALSDLQRRYQYFKATETTQHTTVTVGNTKTTRTTELQRIKSVRAGAVTGGVLTVQVQVNGRDIFPDANRPLSGGRPARPHREGSYTFPANSTISTIVEADSGVSVAPLNVIIETEPFVLEPIPEPVVLEHGDKLRISKRREAEELNAGFDKAAVNLLGTPTGGFEPKPGRVVPGVPKPPTAPRAAPRGDPGRPPRRFTY